MLGAGIEPCTGLKFPSSGLARGLRHHSQVTFDEADRMSPVERAVAAKVAKDMALALLQASHLGTADHDRFAHGFHFAALDLIGRECGGRDLTPERIALALGCSRAARTILTSLDGIGFLVAEIAALSDFHDMPFFTRTFKRRYGMTPRANREASKSG